MVLSGTCHSVTLSEILTFDSCFLEKNQGMIITVLPTFRKVALGSSA